MDESLRERIEKRRQVLQDIKEELVDRLELEVQPDDIDDDTYLFGGGIQLDSIDAMEIVIGIQARFGVEIPEGDFSPLRTINSLADFVLSNQSLQQRIDGPWKQNGQP